MAEEASNSTPRPFDVHTIRYLVALMGRHDLSEIDLREGDCQIRLRRGPRRVKVTQATVPGLAPAAAPPPAAPPAAVSAPAPPEKAFTAIKSPTPGTFYKSPSPNAEPFVKVGVKVKPDTVVCIIEAMKVHNEITADCNGVIAEILVENQQAVEYGEVLFKVDPTG